MAPCLLDWSRVGSIIGKLSFERDQTLAHPVLEQMLDAVRHRGGHGRAIHTAPGIAMGWCGEESSTGHEVAANESRTVRVVADAAISNAGDLRAELARVGHIVRHGTGAELIAHAYEEWGDRCVDRFRGTFAFAVWDSTARRLLLARDHSGARPLHYALLHGHGVVFASTIRSLVTDPGVGREWCPAALDAYLAYGYVPAPLTPYQRISKLEPGQRLVVDGRRFLLTGGRKSSGCQGDHIPGLQPSGGTTAVDRLDAQLRRVVAEQPAGAGVLFSGGPASEALLAQAGRATVIVGLEQNMRALARAHAQAQAAGAHPVIEIAAADMAALAATVAALGDEPNADAALVTHYAVCLAARRHLDAALSGRGGMTIWSDRRREPAAWTADERFAIYTRHFADQVLNSPSPEEPLLPESLSTSLAAAGRLGLDAGIRLHFPHADSRLVEFAASARITDGNLLRTLVTRRGGLPALEPAVAIQRRHDQHPWLRGAIRSMVPALLLSGRFDGRGMVSPGALRQLWDEHRRGHRDHAQRFWALLMLELWFREFIDGGVVAAPSANELTRAA